MMKANVAVVITTHNRGAQLERCLWSVFDNARVVPQVACIVDDGSDDGTSERLTRLAAQYPLRWLRRERAAGWSSPVLPRNMAIRMTPDNVPLLWFLEPEMMVFPDTLDLMLTRWYAEGKQVFVNCAKQGMIQRQFEEGEDGRDPEGLWRDRYTVIFENQIAARSLLVPRDAVFAIRGCDEWFCGEFPDENGLVSYMYGHDDTDLVGRLHEAGWGARNDNNIRVLHQWHVPFLASGEAIDATNLPHMQHNQRLRRVVVNDETWGTDRGRHPETLDYGKCRL